MSSYYIYALVDRTQLPPREAGAVRPVEDYLGAAIYVGKGLGERLEQHVAEARRILARGEADSLPQGSKLAVLCAMISADNEPLAVKLAAPFSDEKEAYAVESFAIDAVDAVRRSLGREPLRNAVKGHGVTLEAESVYLDRLDVETLPVAEVGDAPEIILVKGTADQLGDSQFAVVDGSRWRRELGFAEDAPVDVLEEIGEAPVRLGWNAHMPWKEPEARARAYRYWPIALERVRQWVEHPETMPQFLMMGIPEGGRTVVRYIWEVDPQGRWELHPCGDGSREVRWGIPVKEGLVQAHPFLNKVLVDAKTKHQVLLHRSSGIRIASFVAA
ncbi:LEM-3-like GIY-YIG domain-containing protein [Micrococcus sp.]|uniref:LEM-3-like GIY-YIG domain-containing protein n=1 Tax=Micrococcus sp. TaxID=1271 RepID=UPI002A90CBDF|nr:hypothetical protein [Micrococcus sp.]MDY6054851.1 hypothetical protein [Micrococcus sp.]